MAENDNTILFSVGFDKDKLDKEIAKFGKTFKAGLKDTFKDFTLDLSQLTVKGGIKVQLDLRGAQKQLKDFQDSIKPIVITTTASPVGPTPKEPKTQFDIAQVQFNATSVANLRSQLDGLKASLTNILPSQKDVERETGTLESKFRTIARVLEDINVKREATERLTGKPFLFSDADILKLAKAEVLTENLSKSIGEFDTKQAITNANLQRGNTFWQSFAFQLGAVGFGLVRAGGELQRFGLNSLQFIRHIGDATNALKTMRDITEGNIITQEKLNSIRETFRSTDVALESAFGTNKLELLQLQGKTGVEIIEGLKANLNEQDKALLASGQAWDRLDVAVRKVTSTISVAFQPGVTALANFVDNTLLPLLDELKDKFDALAPSTKVWISEILTAVPVIATALGTLFVSLGTLSIIIASLSKITDLVTAIAASISGGTIVAETGFFAKLGIILEGVLATLVEFAIPLGIIIGLIAAIAVDFGGVRSEIVDGFGDMSASAEHFASVVQKSSFGTGISTFFSSLVGIVKAAFGEVFTLFGAFFASLESGFAGLFDVLAVLFSAKTFGELGDNLVNAFKLSTIRLKKIFDELVLNSARAANAIAFNLHLISEVDFKKANEDIDKQIAAVQDLHAVVENGVVVFKKYSDEVNTTTQATEDQTAALKRQKTAFDELEIAAIKAAKAVQASQTQAAVAQTKEQIAGIETQISSIADTLRDKIRTLFGQDIADAVKSAKTQIQALRNQLLGASSTLFGEETLGAIQNLGTSDLATKTLAAFNDIVGGAGKNAATALQNLFSAKSIAEVKQFREAFNAEVQALNRDGKLTAGVIKGFQEILSEIQSTLDKTTASSAQNKAKALADIDKTLRTIDEEQRKRELQLAKERDQLGEEAKNRQLEADIAGKRAEQTALDIKVQSFLLTQTAALKQRTQLEVDIAELQRKQALAKLDREKADAAATGDQAKVQDLENQAADIKTRFDKIVEGIRAKGDAEIEKAHQDSLQSLLSNTKTAADELLKTIQPFIDRAIRTSIEASQDAFAELSKLTIIGPDGTPISLIENLIGLKNKSLTADLNKQIFNLRNELQAILVSAFGNENFLAVDNTTIPVLKLLGLTDNDLAGLTRITTSQVTKLIQSLAGTEGLKTINAIQEALGAPNLAANITEQAGAEFQVFIGNITKALGLVQELQGLSDKTRKALATQILTVEEQVLTARLDDQISKLNAQIQSIIEGQDLALKKKLLVKQAEFEFQKQDLALQFEEKKAEDKLRSEGATNEEILALEKKLQDDRIALAADANTKIKAITGTRGNVSPLNINTGITPPNATPTTITPGIFDRLESNVGVANPTDKFSARIKALNDGLQETVKVGLDAANSMKQFLDSLANGDLVLATFQGMLDGTASSLDLLKAVGLSAAAAFGEAFAQALSQALQNGENFFKAFEQALGKALMNMGLALIAQALAAEAVAFFDGLFSGGIFAAFAEAAAVLPEVSIGLAAGGALVALGSALGGGNASKTANTASANKASATTGAVPDVNFDPNKDPRTIYQKALKAQIMIDIRTDDTQIVKTIVKEVNGNGRLSTLIGNKRLGFEI